MNDGKIVRIYPDRQTPPRDLDQEKLIEEVISLRQEVDELNILLKRVLKGLKSKK